jgi:RHS repeat-associated protein
VYDGHGSTRFLATAAGTIAIVNGVPQIYWYDAYGNAVGFDPSTAATTLLYSGEQFDARLQMQYLRARFYDPATGQFNGLDSFTGNVHDPQSLHKYLYAHANPISGIDPTGCEFSVAGALAGAGIGATLGGLDAWAHNDDIVTGALLGGALGGHYRGLGTGTRRMGENCPFMRNTDRTRLDCRVFRCTGDRPQRIHGGSQRKQ